MSTITNIQKVIKSISETIQRVIRYISDAVTRIFSPNDDNYPATGVQAFEGDPANDEKF